MLAAGVDVVTAAERQGHSPRVMMEVYAHALPERDRMAAEVLARTLE
jgi:integrase